MWYCWWMNKNSCYAPMSSQRYSWVYIGSDALSLSLFQQQHTGTKSIRIFIKKDRQRRTHILSHETIIAIIIRISVCMVSAHTMIILIQTMTMSELRKSGLFTRTAKRVCIFGFSIVPCNGCWETSKIPIFHSNMMQVVECAMRPWVIFHTTLNRQPLDLNRTLSAIFDGNHVVEIIWKWDKTTHHTCRLQKNSSNWDFTRHRAPTIFHQSRTRLCRR